MKCFCFTFMMRHVILTSFYEILLMYATSQDLPLKKKLQVHPS